MSVSTHEHEAVVAERDELRRELENERARDIHSCGPTCSRNGCVNRRLQDELAELRQQVLSSDAQALDHWQRLASSQAREQQLREALETCKKKQIIYECRPAQNYKTYDSDKVDAALAIPQDTSALQSMIAKAGEVMRGSCENHANYYRRNSSVAQAIYEEIRNLPAITLDDMKG